MEYENNINRREEMLSRFRESLSRPMSERYFDEEDLIEIFDFAGDVGDDYLRMEVLMCAARYYSDSEELNERKAIFFSQYSDETLNKYIDDNQDASGMLWDIMRARCMAPKDDEAKEDVLNNLLDTYDKFTDEEVIQFVDLVSVFGKLDWLKNNFNTIRSKVEYINILLYEVSVSADLNQDFAMSVAMLEELTEIEPFNFYFWTMLAKGYATLDETKKALTAVDYALAINPDDPTSLFIKAKLIYTDEGSSDQVIELFKRLLEIKPDICEAVRLLASIYSERGNKILARVTLSEFLSKYPEYAADIIPDLILYRPKDMRELLDKFYASTEENSQIVWASWAHHLSQNGYADIADEVLDAYSRNSGYKIYSLFPIENQFYKKDFNSVISNLSDYLENNGNTESDYSSVIFIHLMSMIKVGEYDKAIAFCDFLTENSTITKFTGISSRLEYLGLMGIVNKIKERLLVTRDPADWRDFDPLQLWS